MNFKSNRALPPTAIVVTKYDICKDDTDEEELCEIIEEPFSPFFTKDENQKIVTIIPVSIGTNIMDDDCSGKMKALNIHLPIFMGIWFALSKKIQSYENEIQRQEQNTQGAISNLKVRKAREENKWFFKSKSELERLAGEIQEVENKGKTQSQKMKYMLKAMSDNSDKLFKELEKISYVFINGERSSFRDII